MKTSNNTSGNEQSKPAIENSKKKTLDEVMAEIRDIINNTHWIETRLTKLRAIGYPGRRMLGKEWQH